MTSFAASRRAAAELERLVPGGAHTYAKGDDQYPLDSAPIIARGRGAHVWDVDGNEFIEYGSGLRSVILGHGHPAVVDAVSATLARGTNFARPSIDELVAAEAFLDAVPTTEMVKFAKNGSDVTTAAVRLARAITGRSRVAVCQDQPFFSTDDWFIGTTALAAGIPREVTELTRRFPYGDLAAVTALFDDPQHDLAALVLEVETTTEPPEGYLTGLFELAHTHGTLVILDEMITGFRWALGGAHSMYGLTPDLVTFGKAIGNGFSVSALAGRAELMDRGGVRPGTDRVFLLSTTHGAESTGLAALRATIDVCRTEQVSQRLMSIGARLRVEVQAAIDSAGLGEHIVLRGRDCNLVFATTDADGHPSQDYRTLFLRELLRHGVLAPSFVVSAAITQEDIDRTAEAVAAACILYRTALEGRGPTPWMGGRPVQPVMRSRG
ncbi:MAG: glutamate-1-semialdehyde 2,1-aminomutase [Nostocoides sp.]